MNNTMNTPTPFNLEAAMKGHPLVTRDGREAKFVEMLDDEDGFYKFCASVAGVGYHFLYTKDGHYMRGEACAKDLFMAPQPEKNECADSTVTWEEAQPTITTDSPQVAISVMDPKTGTVTLRSLLSNLDDTTAHWIVPLVVEIRMGGNLDLDRKYHVALTPEF